MDKKEKATRTYEVTIEKLIYGGDGIARHNGKVVFVPFSVPGDRLTVRPVEEKKTFIRAEIVRILEAGAGRVAPLCPHFEKCGGCQLQQLEYPQQVESKRQILQELFHHRFPQTRELPITMRACTQPVGYRSRARVQLRGAGECARVGFFRHGSHTIEDIENCPLFRESLNEALSSLRQFKRKADKDSSAQEMDMACSEEEGSWATARAGTDAEQEGITTLVGRRKEDVILQRRVGEFTYSVTASVFFQANDFMISELVASVLEAGKGAGNKSALDLFCGVGLFSLPLARKFARVVAVENSSKAVRLCRQNAKASGLSNIEPVCADVCEWIKSETDRTSYDLLLLDPPRGGAGADIMERIKEWGLRHIIYVSCDPQTLVRDLARIAPNEYRIEFVEGLDMFPQTYHFETVVRLSKN